MPPLADVLRATYRQSFLQALQDGSAKPYLIPYSLLGSFIVPMLWLSVPHVSRPWVYQTRWIVLAFVVVFNFHVMSAASSTNFGCAYAIGLWSVHGILQSLELLVWKRPQFEAARVIKVVTPKPKPKSKPEEEADETRLTDALRQNGGTAKGHAASTDQSLKLRKSTANLPLDKLAQSETMTDDEIEYRWQKFPAEAPFLKRLGWALDLMLSLRGAGWNLSITSIPRPIIPQVIHDNAKVDVSSIPRQTRSGYIRPLTEREFLWTHLTNVILALLAIDFICLQMSADPFFMPGPYNEHELPPLIADKSPLRLLFCRELLLSFTVVVSITYLFSFTNIVHYYVYKIFFPSRALLWMYPSTFGAFSEVLDRGLAGWWGSWWHQTFRRLFISPSVYLQKKGYLKRGTLAADLFGLFVSFFQSGLLHAAGSYTSLPQSKPMNQFWFFLLQGLGILVQQYLAQALRCVAPDMPRAMKRCGNFAFCILWLFITVPPFMGDISACGVWLHEAMPVSVLRLLGLGPVLSYGYADNAWWRWDKEYWFKLYDAKHWWEVGIAI
ncbi:hypothetical protein E4U55_001509 [Claviceps digitariae]|nr:hypothetical protein E4U55_001509 [Claviceps digitariae]